MTQKIQQPQAPSKAEKIKLASEAAATTVLGLGGSAVTLYFGSKTGNDSVTGITSLIGVTGLFANGYLGVRNTMSRVLDVLTSQD